MTPALRLGSGESHFNISLIVRDKVTRECPEDDDGDVELHVLGCRLTLGTNCDQCLSMVQCCFTSTETVGLIRA